MIEQAAQQQAVGSRPPPSISAPRRWAGEGADIEVVDDPDARYALELDTSSGDIAVRTR